ncbi:MAG TPA: ATP-dependent DNA helicase [Saprospiraceae bacterium]|nr:ATP-dependent DNA helicase [Saprospiraceae bacterium]
MTFEEKLTSLNPNQRLAVDSIEGPVMVIAGPGTGKTEILSLRIGNIIRETDTPPSGILCLTYTDAAASEMRHRLIEYIGPEAYKIHVSTFHGFCNLVIQENPGVFQQARELEPISEIERFKLLQKLIDSFDEQHPLKRFKGLTYTDWKKLHELFMTMKKENWSPVYMYEQIEEYISRMEAGETYRYQNTRKGVYEKGQLKPEFKTKVLDRMDTLRSAVGEYDHYNALMAADGKYDFEDMLLWVYDAFDKNPDLLANYQERFLYFLVDEFQDTNGIQMDILSKMIDHEWIDRPNIFVVGDDDQAIFRFQGANVENLISFFRKYNPDVILLEQNYRSSQLILDAARVIMNPVENSVIQQIFGQNKNLLASGKHSAHDRPVHINAYPTPTYENADIFHQLKRWHEEKIEGSFAVLYSKHELGRELAQALKGAGIPFQIAKTVDALNHHLITHLLEILTCISQLSEGANNNDAQLYRILHLTYLDPRPYDLQKVVLAFTAREDRKDNASLYNWISDPDKLDKLTLRDRPWLENIAKLLDESITAYHSMTVLAFVEWVTHHFGIMPWILRQPEKFTHLYALKTFFTFTDLEASGKSSFRIPDLLEICSLMKAYDIRLPIQSLAPPPKGIFLSSLHSAKGLEYEKVVIKNITENEWEKKRAYNQMFSLPDNLVRKVSLSSQIETEAEISDQDRRRLLYVGMTRAKYELTLSYARKKDDTKDLVPSLYLTEIQKSDQEVVTYKPEVDENIQAEYLLYVMSGEQRADLLLDEAEIRDRIKNFVLNVSALNKYLECPLAFYYEKILVIPSGQQVYLIFGTGLHEALQLLFRKKFEERDLAAGKEYLLRIYELYMERNKHRLTPKEAADTLTYGKMVLDKYYDKYSPTWSEDVQYAPEYKIKDIHIEGVPVSGLIDRIDKIDNKLIIYDYKSGKTDKFKEKLKAPDEKSNGGDYWRQMVFYDLMLSQDLRYHTRMDHGWLQALEPEKDGSFKQHKVVISDEDRAIVSRQIVDTYQKIQNMEFSTGCGKCQWCEMHGIVAIPDESEEQAE